MREAEFSVGSPGRLEPTIFAERNSPTGPAKTVKGVGFVPDPLPAGLRPEDLLVPVYDVLIRAERNLSQLEGFARRLKNPGMLMGPFAHKEARHSSAIENTFASGEQLALFDLDDSTVEPGRQPEVREVRNYLAALRRGYDDERPICLNLLKDMHATLMEGATRVAGRPGHFRTTQNAIGQVGRPFRQARFVPPPPEYVPECLDALERYINLPDELPRLVRFALVHYQFECIHPFDDGNGRLGRLLIALQLCKEGQLGLPIVYVSGFLEEHRQEYYDLLLNVSRNGEWIAWTRFFLEAIASQSHDALLRAERLDQLHDKYCQMVQQKRASVMLPRLIDELFQNPAITIKKAAEYADMRPASAGQLVSKLEELGILVEATGRKTSRVYLAPEIIEVMNLDLDSEAP